MRYFKERVQGQQHDREISFTMPDLRTVFVGLCMLLLAGTVSKNKQWNNILPLYSTHSDVERLLGPGSDECKCRYRLKDANVSVVYSTGDCKSGGTGGWNIRAGTVISFMVFPKAEVPFSAIQLDLKRYEKTEDKEVLGIDYYHDKQEGITISVDKGTVMSFHHGPKAKDNLLRCPVPR